MTCAQRGCVSINDDQGRATDLSKSGIFRGDLHHLGNCHTRKVFERAISQVDNQKVSLRNRQSVTASDLWGTVF